MSDIIDRVIATHGWWTGPATLGAGTHCACGALLVRGTDESVRDAHRQHQMETVEQAVRERVADEIASTYQRSSHRPPSEYDKGAMDAYGVAAKIARGEA